MSIAPPATVNYREMAAKLRALPEFKPIKPRQRRFILAFAKTHSVQRAAELADIPWPTHYHWLRKSEQYKQAFDYAKEIAADYAEGDVYERAFIGEERERTKIVDGDVVTEKHRHKSDVLAIFMLKGLKPQYRDNFLVNQVNGPQQLNVSFGPNVVNPLELMEKSSEKCLTDEGEQDG